MFLILNTDLTIHSKLHFLTGVNTASEYLTSHIEKKNVEH